MADDDDILRNPKDPMRQTLDHGDGTFRLMKAMQGVANGHNIQQVTGASINVFVNSLRQCYANRTDVERAFNEYMGKAKSMLLEHYDSVTGRRRPTFAHDQVIVMPHFQDREGFFKPRVR